MENGVNGAIRAWYVSCQRLLELTQMPEMPHYLQEAFLNFDKSHSRIIIANSFGSHLLDYLKRESVPTLHQLALQGQIRPGTRFTHQGQFYGKGFGDSNQTPFVSLSKKLEQPFNGEKLIVDFTKSGIVTDTAYTRLGGSTNLFAFCEIVKCDQDTIKAIPYVVGDLIVSSPLITIPFADMLKLQVWDVDQFSTVDFSARVPKTLFAKMKGVSELTVKSLFCKLLSEYEIPKDWGGESSDIFTSNLSINGRRCTGAFLLKGPAKFHEMQIADCGKNGDQIVRLFDTGAEVLIVQHCHKISPAVRKTVEAFAVSRYSHSCRYILIDGYDTARILLKHQLISA